MRAIRALSNEREIGPRIAHEHERLRLRLELSFAHPASIDVGRRMRKRGGPDMEMHGMREPALVLLTTSAHERMTVATRACLIAVARRRTD